MADIAISSASSGNALGFSLTGSLPASGGQGSATAPGAATSGDKTGNPANTVSGAGPTGNAPGSAANTLDKTTSEAKKAPPPPSANGMQFVYVYDDQLHHSVVKIRDIETQKPSPDSLANGAGTSTATDSSSSSSGSGNATSSSTGSGAGKVGAWVDTTV